MSRLINSLTISLTSETRVKLGIFLCNCLDAKLNVFLTSTYRSFNEQDKLWKDGRLNKNKIVTNVMAGWSFHNYSVAFDVAIKSNKGILIWDVNKDTDNDGIPEWQEVGNMGRNIDGLIWSGNWTEFKEMCHFQLDKPLLELQYSNFLHLYNYILKSGLIIYHIQTYLKKMELYRGMIDGIFGLKSLLALTKIDNKYRNGLNEYNKILFDVMNAYFNNE